MNFFALRQSLALIFFLYAAYVGWQSPWGVVFLLWTYQHARMGSTFLLEPIEKEEHPVFFWLTTLMWVLFCVLMILEDFMPQLFY